LLSLTTQCVLATLNSGTGNIHFNKILASLDIPVFNKNTHQMHEKEVGKVAEEMAQDSCIQATLLKRELTIKNVKDVQKLL